MQQKEGYPMSKTLTLDDPAAQDAAGLQAAIARCIEEMKQLRKQMRRDHAEIEQSAAETRKILSDLSAALKIA